MLSLSLTALNVLILDHLSLFLPTICSNQDLVRTLIKRNPEEFRFLAESLAFLSLPEDLTINSINLTQLCKKDESSSDKKNNLKLPDEGNMIQSSLWSKYFDVSKLILRNFKIKCDPKFQNAKTLNARHSNMLLFVDRMVKLTRTNAP